MWGMPVVSWKMIASIQQDLVTLDEETLSMLPQCITNSFELNLGRVFRDRTHLLKPHPSTKVKGLLTNKFMTSVLRSLAKVAAPKRKNVLENSEELHPMRGFIVCMWKARGFVNFKFIRIFERIWENIPNKQQKNLNSNKYIYNKMAMANQWINQPISVWINIVQAGNPPSNQPTHRPTKATRICWMGRATVHTERTSGTKRLNSSKHPQEPLAARPLKMFPASK